MLPSIGHIAAPIKGIFITLGFMRKKNFHVILINEVSKYLPNRILTIGLTFHRLMVLRDECHILNLLYLYPVQLRIPKIWYNTYYVHFISMSLYFSLRNRVD